MLWNGSHPEVERVTTLSQTGVNLTQKAMNALETKGNRLPLFGKWFVDIACPPLSEPG
jgi:hypothetical protein